MDKQYELKLTSGKAVVWDGEDGIKAAQRYVDAHPNEEVLAWRDYPRHGILFGTQSIID